MERLLKRRWMVVLLAVLTVLFVLAVTQWRAAIRRNRSIPFAPFHIAGNLYYVGSSDVTAFLLTGPEGHVLIDGGYPETAPLIVKSISELGFKITDVKVLLNSHAHFDHAGGLKELQDASGAQLWVSEGDAEAIPSGGAHDPSATFVSQYPAPRIDHRFQDGAVVRLGPLELTAHVTAGHTRGCTSWSFPVQDGARELQAVSICSLSLLPGMRFVEPQKYPGIRADFERSFVTLRSLPADIFLGAHASFFDMHRKLGERATAEDPTPFVDRAGYLEFIDQAEKRFRQEVASQQRTGAPAP
ncbi:MAG TPA: subclass B3 metallo-beta-lactamase [Candidatus Polarisedimenticolaceae bacterium]|nr:subclass B3 metallo-beta-lactamase [Candidatus Polarisedimenticolaceae bacterium]